MGLLKEFREFAMRGNVLDLAVGVIIGAAFGAVVNSLVKDMLMPPIGWLAGGIDFSDKKIVITAAQTVTDAATGKTTVKPEVAISYGVFINTLIQFLIQAFAVFVVIKLFNEARKRLEAQKPVPAPPGPGPEEKLLTEIRDILKQK